MRRDHLIVGREDELARLEALFEDEGPGCALLDGEAGIGKTTLWLHGLDHARRRWRTLVARPAEGEDSLPFSGLGDLLEPLLRLNEDVPLAEREILEPVVRGEPVGRLAVSRAVVSALRHAAERMPLVLAVDDVQWLDPQTAEVLAFACRRLSDAPVRILVARRSDGPQPLPLGLDRAPLPGGVAHIRVGPLPLGALGGILREQLGLRLGRPRLLEIHAASGGNPFYALELGRALLDAGDLEDSEPLPVPDRGALLRRRLDALSDRGRQAALLAAASIQPTATLVERAAGAVTGLAEAIEAGVLAVEGDRLRFSHPLLASAAYSGAPPWERRDAHSRLVDAARDDLERAHHLAASTVEPDADVAAELEAAAAGAVARGAPGVAARLLERAGGLTPAADVESRRRRLLEAAPQHLAAGDPAHARRLFEELAASLPPGPERADLLWQLADVSEGHDEGILLSRQALEEAGDDPATAARANIMLAVFTSLSGDREQAASYARTAASLAERSGDDALVAITIGDLCYRLMILALPYPRAELERALELERSLPDDALLASQRPSFQLGVILGYTDQPDEALPLLRAELERLERAGNESHLISVLFRVADVELRSGNWAEARRLSERALAVATHGGVEQEETVALAMHAAVQAHLGRLDEAEATARAALALAEKIGDRSYGIRAAAVLGFVALSRGDPEAALSHLAPAGAELRAVAMGELSISQVVQNEIEALVAVGRLEEADEAIAYVEEKGRPTQRAWHEAVAARGRALVASARGDVDEARTQLDRALAAHELLPQPFELGRTLLAQGTIERRAKRRAEARAALTHALEVFDQLGAPLWAEKAANELARIPGRAPAASELSETERRIAELVASGLANKEVAARLFVTVRTVEGNLTRIYAKLGVRSRTELAARLARQSAS